MTNAPNSRDQDANRLAALVSSRIAHDLANPVGAIANGVELLELSGFESSPELALISQSVANANLRIKLFRIAFGAGAPGQMVAAGEIATLTAAPREARALAIDWQIAGDMPRAEAKLAFLGLMCVETAMPWGGRAEVSQCGARLKIAASAERTNPLPALWAGVQGAPVSVDELAAGQVHFALLPVEAAAQNRVIDLDVSDSTITIMV